MKKNYALCSIGILLLFLFGTIKISNAQETIVLSENFNNFTAGTFGSGAATTDLSGGLDTLMQTTGWTGFKVYSAGGAVKLGTSSVLGYLQTPVIDLSANGGNFIVRFQSCAWSSDSTRFKVIVNGTTFYATGLNNSNYTLGDYELFLTGGTATTTIRFEGAGAAKGRFFLENLQIVSSNSPTISLIPNDLNFDEVEVGTTKTLPMNVKGVNLTAGGNVSVAISGNGFSTTTTTLANNDLMTSTGVFISVSFNPTAVDDYTGTITFTSTDLATPRVGNLTGSGINVVSVADIAALRAVAPPYTGAINYGDVVYKVTGEVVVTLKMAYKNQKFIQDASGAVLIYDQDGIINSGIEIGDGITNVTGTLTNYYGMIEFVPTADCSVTSYNNSVTPLVINAADLDSNANNAIQAKLIKLEDVDFTATGQFATGIYYDLVQNSNTYPGVVYAGNFSADYIGEDIPDYTANLIGVCSFTYSKNRIIILDDANGGITSIRDYDNVVNNIYPNPAENYCIVENDAPIQLAVYTVTGKLLSLENYAPGKNVIATNNLASGLYFLKITNLDTKKVHTSKLLVK